MSKNISGYFSNLDAIAKFFKECQQEEEEFSQHSNDEGSPYIKEERHHFVHTEDDSITKQLRGY